MIIFLHIVYIVSLFFSCSTTQKIGQDVKGDSLINGIYEGSYKGGHNTVKAKVTIKDKKITEIVIIEHNASPIGRKADSIISERIIAKQSTSVDAVTGATNSSHVIMNAVENAIIRAYISNK